MFWVSEGVVVESYRSGWAGENRGGLAADSRAALTEWVGYGLGVRPKPCKGDGQWNMKV